MKERPTKENTLYLPIKQVYFDQIIAGTKKFEYREIKEGITANRYLLKDNDKKYVLNPDVTEQGKEYFIDDYNNGHFPFIPKPYKYLSLAVGYAKERDTAIVEVIGYSFESHLIRANLYAFWTIAYHLGDIIEVHRVGDKMEQADVEEELKEDSDIHQDVEEHQDEQKEVSEETKDIAVEETKTTTEVNEVRLLAKRSKVFYKECAVAGWSFHDADDFWPELDEGVELALIRQKDNKYDRNAVAVAFASDYDGCPEEFDFDLIIGYVPRTENQFIAQMMDLGYNDMFVAKVTTVKDYGKYDERLRMTIYIQSKEGYEDPNSKDDNLHAMWLKEDKYEILTNSLMYKGFVYFRWGGYPIWEHDLPEKGNHVLCLYKRKSDVVVYLMRIVAVDESAAPFFENPDEELYMVDDCRPYILTNSMGPIVLPLEELSFLDDEAIGSNQPDMRLSKYATTQFMEILLNFMDTKNSDFNSSWDDYEVLPIPQN